MSSLNILHWIFGYPEERVGNEYKDPVDDGGASLSDDLPENEINNNEESQGLQIYKSLEQFNMMI